MRVRIMSAIGRYCSKSPSAQLTENFPGCTRCFQVNMRGTSLPGDELTGDFGNDTDAISISGLELFCFLAGKSLPGNYSVGGGRLNPRIFF